MYHEYFKQTFRILGVYKLNPLTSAPATVVAGKPLISHNSWTDRDRASENVAWCTRQHEIEWEWQKHTFNLKILRKICICAFAVLNFWQNSEKIQKHVPLHPV